MKLFLFAFFALTLASFGASSTFSGLTVTGSVAGNFTRSGTTTGGVVTSGTENNSTVTGTTTYTGIQTGGEEFYRTRLFVANGTYFYRIPSIVKINGTLIAACEARSGGSDDSQSGIAMRRSTDNGKTWTGTSHVVPYASGTCTQNPTFCIAPNGTRVFMLTMKHDIADTRAILRAGSGGTAKIFSQYSDDSGATWSTPAEITNLTGGGYNMQNVGTGQGVISTVSSMMLVPRWRVANGGASTDAVCGVIRSVNSGTTWDYVEAGSGLEASVVSRGSSRVRLNVRNAVSGVYTRLIYTSTNECATFSSGTNDQQLPDPNNSASEISFVTTGSNFSTLTLFCNTVNPDARTCFGLRSSQDNWPVTNWTGARIFDGGGGSGYSSLVQLDNFKVGVLYEGGTEDGYNITFTALNAISEAVTVPSPQISIVDDVLDRLVAWWKNATGPAHMAITSGTSTFTITQTGTGGATINVTSGSLTLQVGGTTKAIFSASGATLVGLTLSGTQIVNTGSLMLQSSPNGNVFIGSTGTGSAYNLTLDAAGNGQVIINDALIQGSPVVPVTIVFSGASLAAANSFSTISNGIRYEGTTANSFHNDVITLDPISSGTLCYPPNLSGLNTIPSVTGTVPVSMTTGTAAAPSGTAAPVGWADFTFSGTTFKIPMYQ